MRILVLTVMLFSLISCGGGTQSETVRTGSLETVLEANDSWPYEVVGILDIVEAGFDDSDMPSWAVGSVVTDDDEFGVLIKIDGTVIARAGINIDSGEKIRVWLEAPKDEYGVTTYPVSKLEEL